MFLTMSIVSVIGLFHTLVLNTALLQYSKSSIEVELYSSLFTIAAGNICTI